MTFRTDLSASTLLWSVFEAVAFQQTAFRNARGVIGSLKLKEQSKRNWSLRLLTYVEPTGLWKTFEL